MYIAQVRYCITGICADKVHEKAAVLHVKADKKGQERGGATDEGKLMMMTRSKLTLITKGKLILMINGKLLIMIKEKMTDLTSLRRPRERGRRQDEPAPGVSSSPHSSGASGGQGSLQHPLHCRETRKISQNLSLIYTLTYLPDDIYARRLCSTKDVSHPGYI